MKIVLFVSLAVIMTSLPQYTTGQDIDIVDIHAKQFNSKQGNHQTCFCQPSRMSHFGELPDAICQKLLKKIKKKPKITNI